MITSGIQLVRTADINLHIACTPPKTNADRQEQPYLDSDFQSRWFDFGGDTVVRADK
jgi:hypothetical protein